MPGRRRLRLVYLLGSLLALGASLHAPTAYSAPGDPPAGSPAGAVYQLPLQQGRADAAPKGGGGTAAGGSESGQGGGGGEGESLYRTENNFGSSSQVPGAPGSGGGGGAAGGSGGAGGANGSGTTGGGSGGGSANGGGTAGSGSGSAGATAGSRNDGGSATGSQVTDTGNTSLGGNILLLGAIAIAAAAIGVGTRRLAHRDVP